jgi:bacterioferritin-associated ferredoxin
MGAAVQAVVDGGSPTVAAVYEACGVAPKCGRCKTDIQRMLDSALSPVTALAAE